MFNKVILFGNLTADPRELRTTQSGTVVGEFRIAVNDPVRKDAPPLFIDVTVWGKTAESCHRYLKKGRPVLVDGRLEEDTWADKETGQQRSKMRVVANQVTFMPDRKDDEGEALPKRNAPTRGRSDDEYEARGGDRDRGRSASAATTGGSPLKDYGLDDEVPF